MKHENLNPPQKMNIRAVVATIIQRIGEKNFGPPLGPDPPRATPSQSKLKCTTP
jgi:hypothetical protein